MYNYLQKGDKLNQFTIDEVYKAEDKQTKYIATLDNKFYLIKSNGKIENRLYSNGFETKEKLVESYNFDDFDRSRNNFIIGITKAISSDVIQVYPDYSAYCYFQGINIYASSSIEEDMKGVLCGRDEKNRKRYDFMKIEWKPLGKFLDNVTLKTNSYTKKLDGNFLFPQCSKKYNWDVIDKFKLYGYDCQKRMISQQTIDIIISDVKSIVNSYQI